MKTDMAEQFFVKLSSNSFHENPFSIFGFFVHNVLMDVANVAGAPRDFEAPNKQFQA
jgi:hypothetical protein